MNDYVFGCTYKYLQAQADEQAELLKKELTEKRQLQQQQVSHHPYFRSSILTTLPSMQLAVVNQPLPVVAAAPATAESPPMANRKVWAKPGPVQLPKQYNATSSVMKGLDIRIV